MEKTLKERLELEIEQNKTINGISEAIKSWNSYDLEEKNKFIDSIFSGLALLPEIKLQIAIAELVKSHILEENEIKKKVNSVRNLLSLEKYKDNEDIFLESEPNKSGIELVRKGYTVKELIESDIPDEKFLIGRGIMPQNGYVLLGGATKEGKTILALQISLNLVSGTNFLDQFPIEKKSKVLYLYAENTVSGLNKILKKQSKALNINLNDLNNFILQEGRGLVINTKQGANTLNFLVNYYKPEVVFIDPISLFTSGDLNKLENITRLINYLNKISISNNRCAWVLIHHYRKPSLEDIGDPIYRVTGSAGFANFCETFIGLDRTHKKRSSNFKTIHFLLRREENPSDIYLHRNSDTLIYEVVSREEAISSGIKVRDLIRVFKEDLEGEEISYSLLIDIITNRLGIKKTRAKELIKEAQDEGLIIKEKGRFGKYKLNIDAELDLDFS